MNDIETKPVSIGDWVLTFLLLSIPFVNIVMLIVWAAGSGAHPSKKNFAIASLIWIGIAIVLSVGFVLLAGMLGYATGHANLHS